MSAVSNGRVLRIALAGSVAVHLLIAAVVYSRPVTAAQEQPPRKLQIVKLLPPPPSPPPPRHALPHPQHHTRAVMPAVHPPKRIAQLTHDGPPIAPPVEPTGIPAPADTSGPDIAPTGAPVDATPAPTPKPACSAPDVPAKTLVAQSPETPEDAGGFTGTAKVKVDLDATGAVVGTSIYESTGNPQLDQAALTAARESRYAPEQVDCKNISGSYLFTIDFQ
jgi:TonB family protein